MLKKMLIVAGCLSLVSVCAQAENTILTNDTTISEAIKDITTEGIRGGAIVNNGHNLTINSDISGNTLIQNDPKISALGGAIAQESGKLIINDGVTFSNNTVTGGSQTYPNWDGVDGASGGAIYITGDFTAETKGTVTFSNNQASAVTEGGESNGGAIFAQGSTPNASITFEKVNFTGNSSDTRGGAIYNGDTAITINGKGEFSNNTSKTGGAVYNYDASGNTNFTTGAETTFTNNEATGTGGAIANFDGPVNIGQNNNFSGNQAQTGGAIANFDGPVNIGQNNNFSGNQAQTGGAIYNSNYKKTAETNILGGTTFTNNTATEKGGAIYNSGSVNMDTTAGNINFTNNSSANGADIYLDGENSKLIVSGTNKNNKVSFGSENSLAGDGKIIHQSAGTFEIKDNKDLSNFTGTYTQTNGKTTLNNSTIFNKYDIQKGELELVNKSNATIDGIDKKFSGSALTIDDSTLSLETNVNTDVNVNIKENGIVNLEDKSSLTMNNTDKWDGTINNNNGALTVDGYKGNGNYTQNGGQITLTNKSDLTLKDNNSSITSGSVNVGGNSTLNVSNGAKIEGNTNTIIASGSKVNVNGGVLNSTGKTEIQTGASLNINNNGNVTLKSDDVWNGILNNYDGDLTVDGYKGNGNYTQSGGKIILENEADLTLNDENSLITSGSVKVGGNSTLNVSNGAKIEGDTNTTITSGSTVNVNGGVLNSTGKTEIQTGANLDINNNGNVTLKSDDVWDGTVNNKSGNLTVDAYKGNANYTQSGGKITLTNKSDLTLKDNNSSITSGSVKVDGNSTLNVSNGAKIEGDTNTTIASGSTVNVDGGVLNSTGKTEIQTGANLDINNSGNVTLKSNDVWDGTVNNNNGNLTVDAYKGNANYTQSGGQITLANEANLTLKDNNSSITSGSVNVAGNSTLNVSNGAKIEGDTNTTITSGSTVNINGGVLNSTGKTEIQTGANLDINNGGNVTLKSDDVWDGTITLGTAGTQDKDSTLTLGMASEEMGILRAENGNLIVQNNNLTIGQNSYIKQEVALKTSGNIKIADGGYVYIDDNDIMESGSKITLNDNGTLDYSRTEDAGALIAGEAGNLNLLSGSKLTLSAGSNIKDAVALDIQAGSKLTLEDNLNLNLDNQDKWNGQIINENGIINTNGLRASSTTASLIQKDGTLNMNDSAVTLGSNSEITGGNIKIENNSSLTIVNALLTGGDIELDKNSAFIVKSAQNNEFTLDSLIAKGVAANAPLTDVMNYQLNNINIGTLNIENRADFNIDILARSTQRNISDKFTVNNFSGDGTIRINDWKLNGDVFGYDAPIDRHIQLGDIFVDKDGNQLAASIETTDATNFSPIGWYQLNKGAGAANYTLDLVKYNPQVFRGQVATVAQWMNQLSIDDMLFTHSMVLPSFKDTDDKMANHYAATDPLFAPYQYSRKEGGIWYKTYGTFEHLQMNNGLHVGNNSYGALIGADMGLKDLKNGWKFMPTAYVGYNGAHQYWSDVSQYQNGGQAGFLGTWYKDNFILGALAYGGIYGNGMEVYGNNDETFNYFAGTAAKASYNIRIHRDFVIQPNLMAAYNYFGQQNWHSNFGQMGMMSGMLHGVNVAPGVNFIWERETFSAYLTLQYMYNINGASGGRAGNVNLPHVEMERGYIQYGIGFTKKFTDRASGYFQAVLRNVGRTGVGFQAGFLYRLGK